MTIGKSWGYRRDDTDLMSSEELIRELVDVASRGGNFLLNVGPTPEGEIPEPLAERLRDIGAWLKKNGESIYGTSAAPSIKSSAGKLTRKDSRLYLHLEDHPGEKVELMGMDGSIEKAWLLETGEEIKIDSRTPLYRFCFACRGLWKWRRENEASRWSDGTHRTRRRQATDR